MKRVVTAGCKAGSLAAQLPVLVLLGGVAWSSAASAAAVSLGVNRVLLVDATGTPEENCDSLREVLSSITDNASNRYLVNLEPGRYSCGTVPLIVDRNIMLAGAGLRTTTVTGAVDSPVLGVIHLQDARTGLRSLTVQNTTVDPVTYARYAVSIGKIGSTALITSIVLRDMEALGSPYSIYSFESGFDTWNSIMQTGIYHDSTATATFNFSVVGGVAGTGPVVCRVSTTYGGSLLGTDCLALP